jgi:predicted enzyme related to lactoylglutathione lyase
VGRAERGHRRCRKRPLPFVLRAIRVSVEDPNAYLTRAEKFGGKTIVPVTEIPNMVTFALFADPEGHVVGIVKPDR